MGNKLKIPLESVSMSAEQYEALCDKIESANNIVSNLNKFRNIANSKGLNIFTDEQNNFINGFNDIIINARGNDMSSPERKLEIQIKLI